MSSCYFILPYDPMAWSGSDYTKPKPTSNLAINREGFRTALFEHWGIDRIQEEPDAWNLTNENDAEGGDLRVNIHEDNQVIAFYRAPKNVFLEFVLWYRTFIPVNYVLYLVHSSSFNRLILTLDTTAENIIELALYGFQGDKNKASKA